MKKEINHAAYARKVKILSDQSLRFIIRNAVEAIKSNPDCPKVGYWQDEINYCCDELNRRIVQGR